MSTGNKPTQTIENALMRLNDLSALLQREQTWGPDSGYTPRSCIDAVNFAIGELLQKIPKHNRRTIEKKMDELFEDTYSRHFKNPNHPDKCKKCGKFCSNLCGK